MSGSGWMSRLWGGRRSRHGMERLQRAYEYVLLSALVEGGSQSAYYDGYVQALNILAAKASPMARAPRPKARGAATD